MKEIYISVDIETNGPIPSDFSMLSFGAAAFDTDGNLLSTFSANLETLPNATEDPATMAWWAMNQGAYLKTREAIQDPKIAIQDFISWVNAFNAKPVFVAYPSGFDFTWMYWYMVHFVGRSPFSFSALDIKSYAMAVLKTEYRKSTKKNMPKHWFPEEKHTHIAVEDAIEQGRLFFNMLKDNV